MRLRTYDRVANTFSASLLYIVWNVWAGQLAMRIPVALTGIITATELALCLCVPTAESSLFESRVWE